MFISLVIETIVCILTWLKTVPAFINVCRIIFLFENGRIVIGVGDRYPQVDDRLLALAVVVGSRVG
jgi:hypothetical protein